jgi:hypothetical protein
MKLLFDNLVTGAGVVSTNAVGQYQVMLEFVKYKKPQITKVA